MVAGGGASRGDTNTYHKINSLEPVAYCFTLNIRERKQFSAFVLGIVHRILLWSSPLVKKKKKRCKCHSQDVWGRELRFDSERCFKSVISLSGSARPDQKNVLRFDVKYCFFQYNRTIKLIMLVPWLPGN